MPNKKAAEKFLIKSESQRLRNQAIRSRVRNLARKVLQEKTMESLKLFEKNGMSAVSKGVFHINTIARKVSRLYAHVKKANA